MKHKQSTRLIILTLLLFPTTNSLAKMRGGLPVQISTSRTDAIKSNLGVVNPCSVSISPVRILHTPTASLTPSPVESINSDSVVKLNDE